MEVLVRNDALKDGRSRRFVKYLIFQYISIFFFNEFVNVDKGGIRIKRIRR